jgi:nucleotide-binding universal stress UspA family protein
MAQSVLAARIAIKLAVEKEGTEVIVLHILEIPSFVYYHSAEMTNEMVNKGKAEVEKWFNQIANSKEVSKVKLKTHIIISTQSAYSEIIKYAEEEGVDLIVVGTREKTGLKGLLLGSVAANVVKYASCTVMVVKADKNK